MKKANITLNVWSWLLALVIALGASANANAQCTLVCNNLSNLSMDEDCDVEVFPDMVLEGNGCPNGNLQVQAKINNVWVPSSGNWHATPANIGQTLQVRVRDLNSGNMCWGTLKIEDKLAPQLECEDVWLVCAVTNYDAYYLENILGIDEAVPTADDNCTNASLTPIDGPIVDLGCNAPLIQGREVSAYFIRKWTAVDAAGNSATCEQYVYFERVHLLDIDRPDDVTITDCSNPDTDPSNTGTPYVAFGGVDWSLYPNSSFCEVNTAYTD